VAVLGFEAEDPTGYGRLLAQGGRITAIREHRDASEGELAVTLCNGGLMAIRGDLALGLLDRIGNTNAQGEYYLTDVVEIANALGHEVVTVIAAEEEIQGINDRAQLAKVEAVIQRRLRQSAMAAGVTLVAPETVYFSSDTRIGRDTVVEPHVVFGRGVVIEEDVVVHAFCYLEGAHIASGASVGPFARLRPGTVLGRKSKVGNFVEMKNSNLGQAAKVNHLTYLGDATVGAGANIGAGTITCNYDGFNKHRTIIGEGAFVGSNSALVAPVSIGDRAYIGSGSVITGDVPDDALAVARGRQAVKAGWAIAFRIRSAAAKAAKAK
jgi:bifunctional UDP-N-acetylglucosamine pyrophosphorylase/glucosamine-1-phosphate N-acetyltransferase